MCKHYNKNKYKKIRKKNIGKEKKKITLCVTLYCKELKVQQPNKLKWKKLK